MTYRRASLLATSILAGLIGAKAQQASLPAGLTQQGGVIMMQPIADTDATQQILSGRERRTGMIHVLSPSDHDVYTRAFDAGERGDWIAAKNIADQGHDPVARRLVQWRYVLDKNSGASFAEIDGFLKQNPNWPLRDTLFARAENAIGPDQSPAATVSWFGTRQPASAIGEVRLGEALVATGRTAQGRELIRQGWAQGSFDPGQELAIVQKDGAYLTPDIDRVRLDNLLWHDDTAGARRELARVDDAAERIGEARLALRSGRAAGQPAIDRVPASLANDPGLLFDRARASRRAGQDSEANALILRISDRSAAAEHPAKWWSELNVQARNAVQAANYRTAYALVSDTGLTAGEEFAEAEFLAGWIALRFLDEPRAALTHFEKLEAGVTRPISRARAHYWQGRAHEAMGSTASAFKQYQLASQAPESFYGQLALARIDATPVLHVSDAGIQGSSRKDFDAEDLTRAMTVLADLGEESLLRTFALHDMEVYPDPSHTKSLAQALTEWGYREIAVRVAKTASYSGTMLLAYTHPVIAVPTYSGPGAAPEQALVLGLIRQETEFDPDAVSGPGARGIMQMMPSAARRAAGQAGIAYRPNDLSDPSYNMQLGMTELSGDISNWAGSYVLAAAAYNAGPANVGKWLVEFGDPRNESVDPIDWIEKIPFTETRNYVQRVLENTQIYRNRLTGRDQPLKILADIYRPNSPSAKVLAYSPPAQTAQDPAAAVPLPKQKPAAN
jgi:soluble lytic murein transglycosylase